MFGRGNTQQLCRIGASKFQKRTRRAVSKLLKPAVEACGSQQRYQIFDFGGPRANFLEQPQAKNRWNRHLSGAAKDDPIFSDSSKSRDRALEATTSRSIYGHILLQLVNIQRIEVRRTSVRGIPRRGTRDSGTSRRDTGELFAIVST